MIVGVGTDVVSVARFAAALERTPALVDRLFTPAERLTRHGRPRTPESLAARFAAKEAVAKALGGPPGLRFTDAEVSTAEHGAPVLAVTGSVERAADRLGVDRWHVSLTHDGGLAHAIVIAERTAR